MPPKEYPAPNKVQRALLRRHGLDWRNYMVKRELTFSVFFIDRRDRTVKIIDKNN